MRLIKRKDKPDETALDQSDIIRLQEAHRLLLDGKIIMAFRHIDILIEKRKKIGGKNV